MLTQGDGFDTLDIEASGVSSARPDGTNYERVSVSLAKVTGETGDFDLEAVRALLLTAKGSIAAAASQEAPERGSIAVPHRASQLILPNDFVIEPRGKRLVVTHPSFGVQPLDNSTVKSARYADLDDHTNANTKLMPNDGTKIVHFGHAETGNKKLRFRNIRDHISVTGFDGVIIVKSIKAAGGDCLVQDRQGNTLINLKPGQDCEFQVGIEAGGSEGEIVAIRPPPRKVVWGRGVNLDDLGAEGRYGYDGDLYSSLPWPTSGSGVHYIDNDGFTLGTSLGPTVGSIATRTISQWDMAGSFQIDRGGTVDMNMEYGLLLETNDSVQGDDATLSGALANGHGISLWVSEEGTGTLTRVVLTGLRDISGEGAYITCRVLYRDDHAADTRFVIMQRIPSASDINNFHHVHMEALNSYASLLPVIRETDSDP